MSFDAVQFGTVIHYPYLWAREATAGETEGRKSRPVAVGVRLARRDGDGILLLPITSSRPGADRLAIEIPALEKRRAGLDKQLRLWLILDEYNFRRPRPLLLSDARSTDRPARQDLLPNRHETVCRPTIRRASG